MALQEFLEASMDDPANRAQLTEDFGLQLTAMALAGGQYDRARFHLSNCYRNFRKKWGSLHPLAMGGRHAQVRGGASGF